MSKWNKYMGVRPYIEEPLLINEETSHMEVPSDFKDFLNKSCDPNQYSKFNMYNYDTGVPNNMWGNIFTDFVAWQIAHPEFFQRVKMDKHQAAIMEFKSRLIAKSFYGDSNLFYTILIFNDIVHESELTKDMLENQGIIALTDAGMDALQKILDFKRRYEVQVDGAFDESRF